MATKNKYEAYLTNRMTESANSRLMSINNVNRFLKDLYSSDLSLPSKSQFRNAEQTAVEIYRQASNGQDSSDISEMKFAIDSFVANTLGVNVRSVATNRSVYWKNMFGLEDTKTIWTAISDSFTSWSETDKLSKLANSYLNTTDPDLRADLIEDMREVNLSLGRLSDPNKPYRNMPANAVIGAAAQIPDTFISTAIALGTSAALLGLATLAGVYAAPATAGVAAASAAGAISVPKVALALGTVASKANIFKSTYDKTRGLMIYDLLNMTDEDGNKIDIDDQKVKDDINLDALIEGGLEVFSDVGFDMMVNKGLLTPVKGIIGDAGAKAAKGMIKYVKKTGSFAGATLLDTLSESATEGLEGATGAYFKNRILKYANSKGSNFSVVDDFGFDKAVSEFTSSFLEAVPTSLVLGSIASAQGSAINFVSYEYDKRKISKANELYGMDFEASSLKNEFATSKNNAFSEEKYKVVDRNSFNVTVDKMSDESKAKFNEMLIIKETKDADGNPISQNIGKRLSAQLKDNKRAETAPEGFRSATIRDRETKTDIEVFVPEKLTPASIVVDNGLTPIGFNNDESEATIAIQRLLDTANGVSAVPVQIVNVDESRHASFDHTTDKTANIKSFADEKTLQKYVNHSINSRNRTIEFPTKSQANKFIRSVRDSNAAISGNNYYLSSGKTQLVFRIGDNDVAYTVKVLDNKNSSSKSSATLNQASFVSIPDDIQEDNDYKNLVARGSTREEAYGYVDGIRKIKQDILSKLEASRNEGRATQNIKSTAKLNNIAEAGARALFAIQQRTGISTDEFMDMIDFRFAGRAEMDGLNGSIEILGKVLNQQIEDAESFVADNSGASYITVNSKQTSKANTKDFVFKAEDGSEYKFSDIKDANGNTQARIVKSGDKVTIDEFESLVNTLRDMRKNGEISKIFHSEDADGLRALIKSENGLTYRKLINDVQKFLDGNMGKVRFADDVSDVMTALQNTGLIDAYMPNKTTMDVLNPNIFTIEKLDGIAEGVSIDDKGNTTVVQKETDSGRAYKYTITLTKNANASTIVHEAGHMMRDMLTDEELAEVSKIYGVDIHRWLDSNGEIKRTDDGKYVFGLNTYDKKKDAEAARNHAVFVEERFADDFVRFVDSGKADSPILQRVFSKIRQLLRGVAKYISTVAPGVNQDLSDDVIAMFNKLLKPADGLDTSKSVKKIVTEQGKKLSAVDVDAFIGKGYYIPLDELERSLNDDGDRKITAAGHDMKLSEYIEYRDLLNKSEESRGTPFDIFVYEGSDTAKKYLAEMVGDDATGAILLDIVKEISSTSLKPSQYVAAIQNKLINDPKYMLAESQAIAESFGPYRLSKSGKIELRQYEPADNSAVRNARAIRDAIISGDKSAINIAVDEARQDVLDNPQIWAREVFRAESLYDINYEEGQQWYYDSMLDDKNRYFNYLMTFGDDSLFAFTNEAVDNNLKMDVDEAELRLDDADKIDKEIGMFGDRIGKILYGLDATHLTDEARNNAIVGMEKEFAERARKDAIRMADSIAEDKFRDTLAYVNDKINLISRLLDENGIVTDELKDLREFVNELSGSTRMLTSEQVLDSIENIKKKFDGLNLDSVDEVFSMSIDDLDSLDKMLSETADLIDESVYDYAESERLINNLLHAIDMNSYIKQNEKLQYSLNNALNDLADAKHKINVQTNRISRLKNMIDARNNDISQLKAAIKALSDEKTALKAHERQLLSYKYKKKIVARTTNPTGADVSYAGYFTYINYLVGNKINVSREFSDSLDYADPSQFNLVLANRNNPIAEDQIDQNPGQPDMDVYMTTVGSDAGKMIEEYRYFIDNGYFYGTGYAVMDDGAEIHRVSGSDKYRVTGDSPAQIIKSMPVEVKNAIKKATAMVSQTADYNDVINKIVTRQFGAWGAENQKIVYKAVGILLDDARELRNSKVQQRNLNAANLATKMAEGLNSDFRLSDGERNTLILGIIDPKGYAGLALDSDRYKILDAYFDFSNHKGLYQDIINRYGNMDPFDIIADQDDVKIKLASKLLYEDQFKIMDFTVKDDFVSPYQKFKDSMRIETSQPSLIFNYLSERSGDRYDSEFEGSFNDFFIRQALDNDVAEKKSVNSRFESTAEEFRNEFGMDYKKRAKVFDTADVLGPDGKFHTTEELGLLSINKNTAVRNDMNGGNVNRDRGKYTRSEMLTLYMHTRHIYDEKSSIKRIGNGFDTYNTRYTHQFICLTDKKFGHGIDANELIDMHYHPEKYLTDNEIRYADFMMNEIKSPFAKMKSLTEDLSNRLMVSEKNYFPMEAENASDNDINSSNNFFRVNVNKKMTVARTNSIYRINLDSIDVYEKNIRKQEHFIHWAEWADTFNRIWGKQGNLEEVMLKTMGEQMKQYVYDYASLMANRQYFSPKRVDNILGKLIGNASMARVAGSPLTIIRQTGSYLSGTLQMHTSKEMFRAASMLHEMVPGTNMKWSEFIDELDPDMMDRMLSPMMEDSLSAYRKESGNAFIAAGQEATAQLMKGIQWMDKFVAKQIWMANYIKESEGKVPDKTAPNGAMYNADAAYKAMMAVRKTQSGSSVIENTMLQNKAKYGRSTWAKFAVLFANDIIKLQSDMYWGSGRDWRHNNKVGAFVRIAAVPLVMTLFNCILNFDWIPEDDEDEAIDWDSFVTDILQELPTEFIPIAGKSVTAHMRGYGSDDYMPFASEISKLITTFDRIIDPPRGTTRMGAAVSGIKDMAIGAAAYAGLPSELARKGMNVIFDTKNLDIRLNPLFLLNTNLGNWGEEILPWRQ